MLHALRLGEQIADLVGRMKPHTLITTYEGHSWERVAYARAREINPAIHCIGYQHAGLFNMQHAAFRPLAPEYNPDTILSVGPAGRDAVRDHPSLRGVAADCVGSSRSMQAKVADQGKRERNACLVVPEGDPRECELLFVFSLTCAHQLPNMSFLWRLHPNTRVEDLVRQYPLLAHRPNNVHFSTAPLDEDIARSRWVLYRGSTAVIHAALGGAYPIYRHIDGEIPIDVLYKLGAVRGCVDTVNDFVSLVGRMTETERLGLIGEIQNHCERMFVPLDVERFVAIVSAGRAATSGRGPIHE